MQKNIKLIILLLILCSSTVFAKNTCNDKDIIIKSINVNNKSGFVEEVNDAKFENNTINLDLKMYDIGDSIDYNILIKNESDNDYYFDSKSFNISNDYIEYMIVNDNEIIKSKEEKLIQLKIKYKNKIVNKNYNDTNKVYFTLSDKPLENPITKTKYMFIVIVILILCTIAFKKLKNNKMFAFLLAIFTIIPFSVMALCTVKYEIEANIEIDEKDAIFLPGKEVNAKMKELAGDDTSTSTNPYTFQNQSITSILKSDVEPDSTNKEEKNIVSTNESPYPIYMWFDNGIIYWWSEDTHPSLNEDATYMFGMMNNLRDISGVEDYDASSTTNLTGCFYYNDLSSLISLKNWNVSKVKNYSMLFGFNQNLENLSGLEDWDTSSATVMSYLFYYDISLTSIKELKNWDVSNVTDMSGIFYYNTALDSIKDLRNWNTLSVISMRNAFSYNTALDSIEGLENWDVSSVTNMTGMFLYNNSLNSLIPLRNWKTSSLLYIGGIFNHDIMLTSLEGLENWDTSNVIDMSVSFHNCVNLMNASAISNWNVSNVEYMNHMFNISNDVANDRKYSELPELNIKNWNMSKVKRYDYFIEGLQHVETEFTIRSPYVESYGGMLGEVSMKSGQAIVNYTAETETLVDEMIKTKHKNCNVIKGTEVS